MENVIHRPCISSDLADPFPPYLDRRQWRIQDFPDGGRQPQNCMKMKEKMDREGGRASSCSPQADNRSANGHDIMCDR